MFTVLVACGGTTGGPDGKEVDFNSPECRACADTLDTETAVCRSDVDDCTNRLQDTEAHIACFQQDGQCHKVALDKASACHDECGDTEQANVETCAGVCFTDRADCTEVALRVTDACLDFCSGVQCDQCTLEGQFEIGVCNDLATTCANECVKTHRSS